MPHIATIALVTMLAGTSVAAPESESPAVKIVEELSYQTFKDVEGGMGDAVRAQKRERENKEIRSLPQVKTARECAKPGNVIDEDVRRCMKGL